MRSPLISTPFRILSPPKRWPLKWPWPISFQLLWFLLQTLSTACTAVHCAYRSSGITSRAVTNMVLDSSWLEVLDRHRLLVHTSMRQKQEQMEHQCTVQKCKVVTQTWILGLRAHSCSRWVRSSSLLSDLLTGWVWPPSAATSCMPRLSQYSKTSGTGHWRKRRTCGASHVKAFLSCHCYSFSLKSLLMNISNGKNRQPWRVWDVTWFLKHRRKYTSFRSRSKWKTQYTNLDYVNFSLVTTLNKFLE